MKHVLLLNGSPHPRGCTYTALEEIRARLESLGISAEIIGIGTRPVRGCIACGGCAGKGACVFGDDPANDIAEHMARADGIIIGTPVYYAGPNGALLALLDRVFYSRGRALQGKPAAAVVSCRRGGASASFDRLNKYFTINNMPVVPSCYWNSVHGNTPDQVRQDLEGLQVMRTLADNMAWMLASLDSRPLPVREERIYTNFIR